MTAEYVEIVHADQGILDLCRRQGPRYRAIADRISNLEVTLGVAYVLGSLQSDIPELPKDTPIRIGGGMWELCVQGRADELKKAGYQNVTPDRSISFSVEDIYADMWHH